MKNNDKTRYNISKAVERNIDNVLSNINERNPVKLRDYTPKALVNNGIKDLPMYENPFHIRTNILTEQEAIQKGIKTRTKDNYHGLGKDLFIKVIDSIDRPRVIFKKNDSNDYIILTELKDANNKNIIVPIDIETITKVNRINIDTNRIKSAYGRNNLKSWIEGNINRGVFTKIYENKKAQGMGTIPIASAPKNRSSLNNNSIAPKE